VTIAAMPRSWIRSRGSAHGRFCSGLRARNRAPLATVSLITSPSNGDPGLSAQLNAALNNGRRASPLPSRFTTVDGEARPHRIGDAQPWGRGALSPFPATTNRLADTARALPATAPPGRPRVILMQSQHRLAPSRLTHQVSRLVWSPPVAMGRGRRTARMAPGYRPSTARIGSRASGSASRLDISRDASGGGCGDGSEFSPLPSRLHCSSRGHHHSLSVTTRTRAGGAGGKWKACGGRGQGFLSTTGRR